MLSTWTLMIGMVGHLDFHLRGLFPTKPRILLFVETCSKCFYLREYSADSPEISCAKKSTATLSSALLTFGLSLLPEQKIRTFQTCTELLKTLQSLQLLNQIFWNLLHSGSWQNLFEWVACCQRLLLSKPEIRTFQHKPLWAGLYKQSYPWCCWKQPSEVKIEVSDHSYH